MNKYITCADALNTLKHLLYETETQTNDSNTLNVLDCAYIKTGEIPFPKWIPVTERLPERYGRFIVTIVPDAGELWKTIEFAMYSDLMGLVKTPVFWKGNVGKYDFEDVTSKVTAWMPLPEPYRKETDNV